MPTIVQTERGVVTGLWGTAMIRGVDGQMRLLKLGDVVVKGDVILTTQNGIVQLSPEDSGTAKALNPPNGADEIERVITAIEQNDPRTATAAGLGAGGEGSLQEGLRVGRIAEGVSPLALPGLEGSGDLANLIGGTGGTTLADTEPGLRAGSGSISALEEGPNVGLGLGVPAGLASNASVVVDRVPSIGQIVMADGTPVSAGMTLAPSDLPGLRYVPPAEYDGTVPPGSFGYTLSSDGQSVNGAVQINLAPVNDPPLATAGTASGNEDSLIPISLGGSDPDGNVAGITVTALPAGATLFLADGVTPVGVGQLLTPAQAASLLLRPAADFNGTTSLAFTVTDNGGAVSAPASVVIDVAAVNDAPVAIVAGAGSGNEDAPIAVRLAGTDVDGTVVAVTVTALPANGTLFLADGVTPVSAGAALTPAQAASLVFVPAPDFNGTVQIGFFVTDNDGAVSAPAIAPVTVLPVNDAPVAQPDVATTSEDVAVGGNVLANDGDADGTALAVTQFSFGGIVHPAGSSAIVAGVGTLVVGSDGTWTFTPAPNFNGAVPPVSVTIGDGTAITTAPLTISVTPVNDAPIAAPDLASTPINTAATIAVLANDADPDGDTVTVTAATLANPALGSVAINPDGTLTFTPALNFSGSAVISYTIADPSGATSTASVTVNVGSNTPPTGADALRTLAEDGSYTFAAADFGFADADLGQTLAAVRIDTLPAAGTLTLAGVPVAAGQVVAAAQIGNLVFTPAADANGAPYSGFSFSVQDNGGAFDAAPNGFVFNVTPANDAPVAANDSTTTAEDTAASGNVLGNDADIDGDTLAVTQFVVGGTTYVAGATATIAGVGALTIASNGAWTFVPAADYTGPVPVATYTVSDGSATTTASLTIAVTPVNDAPVAQPDTATTPEDTPVGGNLLGNDSDVDGPALGVTQFSFGGTSYSAGSVATLPGVGSLLVNADGTWLFTPAADYAGAVPVAGYTVSDGSTSSTSTLTITLTPTNDTPVAANDTFATNEDTPITFDPRGNDADVDGDALAVTSVAGQPIALVSPVVLPQGTVSLNADGTLTFVPAANVNGPVVFAYTVSDGTATATAQVTVNVAPVNDAPVALDDVASTPINTPLSNIAVLSNDADVDGPALSVTSASLANPALGSVSINPDGTLNFTPATNVSGTVLINYSISDGAGGTASATLSVLVGANTPPTGADASFTLAEDTSRTFSAADFGFADADAGQSLAAVRIDSLPAAGVLTLSGVAVAAGQLIPAAQLANLVFTPAPNANGNAYASFTFSVQDNAGGFDTAPNTITLNVTPVADAAIIGGTASGATVEDTTLSASGTLTVTDPDAGEAAFVPQASVAGAHGTFSIDAAGNWTYSLNNADPAVQALGAGQTLPAETFTVSSIDGTTATVSVSITGTNDGPVAQGASFTVNEDAAVVNGSVLATDADANAVLSFALNGAAPAGLIFNANGSYSFDPANAAYQSLAAGQTQVITVPYTVTDDQGATSSANLVITVVGQGDAPVIAGPLTGSVTEDGTTLATGALTIADPDAGQSSFVAQAGTPGVYGTFSVNTSGAWTYTLNNAAANVQSLAQGQAPTESFIVTTADGSTRTVVVTVNGSNDAPVTVNDSAATSEDAPVSGNVLSNDSDVDTGAVLAVTQFSVAGVAGTFAAGSTATIPGVGTLLINDNGSYTFTPVANYNGAVPVATYTVSDGVASSTGTLTLGVTAVNDAPVAVADTGALAENATLSTSAATGVLANDTDVDAGDTKTVSAVSFGATVGTVGSALAGTYGTLTLNADGSYSYSANGAAAEALAAGATATESFNYTVRDAAGATSTTTLTFTITGTNDAPVITGPLTGAVTEDGTTTSTGTLTIVDVDAGQSTFVAQSGVAGTYGSFSLSSAGVWTYTLNNAAANVQQLAQGVAVTDTFAITTADGTARTVVVTVNGTNDVPVAVADAITVNEDTVASGNVLGNDSDVDAASTLAVTQFSVAGIAGSFAAGSTAAIAGVGTLVINANGSYTFTPAANYSGAVPVATYTVSDGIATNTATLSVTLAAQNDAPVNTLPGAQTVLEDVRTPITGISVADPDEPGSSASDKLATVQLSVSNGTLLVTLSGGATVSAGANGSSTLTLSGTQAAINATLATLGYQGNANYNGGDTLVITTRDGLGLTDSDTVAINVTPVNDAPSGADRTITIVEDGSAILARSDFGFTDAAGEGHNFVSVTVSPTTAGTLTLNGVAISAATVVTVAQLDAGQLRFTPAPNANGNGYASFTFQVRDSGGTTNGGVDTDPTPNTITFNVTPANDAPVALADAGSLAENATLSATAATGVLANDTDVDAGDTKTVSAVSFGATAGTVGTALVGTYGTLTLNADGSYSYAANRPASDALAASQTANEVFSYTVRDAAGATSTTTITFTITGTNDAPVAVADVGSTPEDVPVSGNVLSNDSDVDAGAVLAVTQFSVAGVAGSFAAGSTATIPGVGTLLINANGSYTFTPVANYNGAVPVATYTVSDGTASSNGTLTLNVTAVNDAPLGVADVATAVEAGGVANGSAGTNPSGNVLANDTDVDVDDTRTVSAITGGTVGGSTAGAYGTLVLNADGSYTYTVNNSLAAVQALRTAGNTLTDSFTYTVRDAAGLTSSTTLTVTIQGANDAPVAVANTGNVAENATLAATAATGVLANDIDVDAGDTKTVSAVSFGATAGTVGSALAGTYGTLTLNADGSYSYSANRPAADALAPDQTANEVFSYTVRDTAGATSTTTITFTITGTNDAPVAANASIGVTEDGPLFSGSVSATDPDAGAALTFALTGAAPAGLTFNSNGSYTFDPSNAAYQSLAAGQQQVITVPYQVSDGNGGTSTANLVITVTGTNDAPVAAANTVAATEDTALTIPTATLLANDTDADAGATLTITSVQSPVNGTVALVGGNVVFTPAANFSGAASFTYTVSDGQGGSSTASVTVNVAAVADAPTLVIDTTGSGSGSVTSPTLPPSTGLTRAFYDNIASVSAANAGTISAVETAVEGSTPTSTSVVTDVSIASVGVDDAYRYTGFIFLEAGRTYTVTGSRDDTLMVKIGGTQVYGVGFNNWGAFTATTYTPTTSGYYSIEVTAYNGDGVGDLDINLSVNGGPALDLNTTNFNLYANAAGFAGATVAGPLVPNGDGGHYPTNYRVGNEDTAIRLGNVTASLVDTDGSETLSVAIGNIPAGAVLSDGTNSFTATAGASSVVVTGWTLANLTLTPPANFSGSISLNVSATATEATGPSATTSATLPVVVTPTVDAPAIQGATQIVAMAQGAAGQATVNFPIMATLVDADGSETISYYVSGVPTGASFSAGTNTGNGVWSFTAANLSGLTLTLPAGYSTNGTALTVTAVSTETATGTSDSVSSTVTLVADYTTTSGTGNNSANTYNGTGANNYYDGGAGDDVLNGNDGDDYLIGGTGNDTLNGGTGNDLLVGNAGNDIIVGGASGDRIVGGAGNDTLTGGTGAAGADLTTDVFAWTLADRGSAGTPAIDTITDFNVASASAGGDVLDLRDLLSGEALGAGNTVGNLANFLDFSVSGSGASAVTTIRISTTGQFTGGTYASAAEDQSIVLQGVDLPTGLGLASGASDAQIIQELINRGKLVVDNP
jgi:VCBS repeat-containing protein